MGGLNLRGYVNADWTNFVLGGWKLKLFGDFGLYFFLVWFSLMWFLLDSFSFTGIQLASVGHFEVWYFFFWEWSGGMCQTMNPTHHPMFLQDFRSFHFLTQNNKILWCIVLVSIFYYIWFSNQHPHLLSHGLSKKKHLLSHEIVLYFFCVKMISQLIDFRFM